MRGDTRFSTVQIKTASLPSRCLRTGCDTCGPRPVTDRKAGTIPALDQVASPTLLYHFRHDVHSHRFPRHCRVRRSSPLCRLGARSAERRRWSRHRNEPGRRLKARDGFSTGIRLQLIHSHLPCSFLILRSHEAGSAGGSVVLVDPRGTSQRCSGCGAEPDRPKTLADRVHGCDVCGLVLDRDVNDARNVLQQLKGPGTGLRSRSVRVAA